MDHAGLAVPNISARPQIQLHRLDHLTQATHFILHVLDRSVHGALYLGDAHCVLTAFDHLVAGLVNDRLLEV